MLRLCEACNGFSFYFHASLIKNLLAKTAYMSYYSKLSLQAAKAYVSKFLPNFSLMFVIYLFLIKNVYVEVFANTLAEITQCLTND